MSWFFLAVGGHLLNAAAFIIDKSLLSKALKHSLTYAVMIGMLPAIVIVAAPWVDHWPSRDAWWAIAVYGGLFVFALWGFFESLKRAEASRVVPVVGSLIPVLTLGGSAAFLGERFDAPVYAGLACLVAATWILTRNGRGSALDGATLGLCVLSAALFASASVAGKYAYDSDGFLGVFVSSRLVGVAVSAILIAFASKARREALALIKKDSSGSRHPVLWLAATGQTLGAVGFLLVNAALSLGSATIVNALQAVQYAAIVLIAWLGGERLNRYLKEERTASAYLRKGFAIALVAIGLALTAGTIAL